MQLMERCTGWLHLLHAAIDPAPLSHSILLQHPKAKPVRQNLQTCSDVTAVSL
jgi:hypothetical protein